MKFFETSKYYSLKKSTYISLRWIGIIGQLISIYLVYFYLNFTFDFIHSNIVIIIGILSNLYLTYVYKKTQVSDRAALIFLLIDIFQLGTLIYLTGGILNPFIIFLIIPSIFASSNLGLRTNLFLIITTILIILYLFWESIKFNFFSLIFLLFSISLIYQIMKFDKNNSNTCLKMFKLNNLSGLLLFMGILSINYS